MLIQNVIRLKIFKSLLSLRWHLDSQVPSQAAVPTALARPRQDPRGPCAHCLPTRFALFMALVLVSPAAGSPAFSLISYQGNKADFQRERMLPVLCPGNNL